MKILNVQGRKKTGKTTTVTNIISELCRRGYSVGSIKAIHIDGFTMDSENEDTGKHKKAGADPVTARCHGETNIMFKGTSDFRDILRHYDNDWVIIESHVDLLCPNIITGRTYDMLTDRVDEYTIGCSGVVAGTGVDNFTASDGRILPVINSITDISSLVDLIESKTDEYVYGTLKCQHPDEKTFGLIGESANNDGTYDASRTTTEPGSEIQEKPASIKTRIIIPDKHFSPFEEKRYISIAKDGTEKNETDMMLMENTIDIYINEIRAGSVPHTPENVAELVIGWAQSQGYFTDTGEVDEIEINDDFSVARMKIFPTSAKPDELRKSIKPVKTGFLKKEWKKEWIFYLAKDFENILPLRKATMAAHNARLAIIKNVECSALCDLQNENSQNRNSQNDNLKNKIENEIEIVFRCEDIGRHSAIDKAVGWALINGIDTSQCILFSSGRISREMVEKVIRAGIPIMAGKGTISKKAVQLARENDLVLIGYAGQETISVFNN